MAPFISKHPGGRFVLTHTIGTDISKFFFGGYSLEGNIGKFTFGHSHSSQARRIVNDLVIAFFEKDLPIAIDEGFLVSQEKTSLHSLGIKTIYLKSTKETVFKSFYKDDERYLGKHFRVTWGGDMSTSRHYTVSNVMEPRIYLEYIDALETETSLENNVVDDKNNDY